MGFVVDKIALIQIFIREMSFSLVSMTASTTDPLRSRTAGQLETVVPRYITLSQHKGIKMLLKVLGLYQSGAYQ